MSELPEGFDIESARGVLDAGAPNVDRAWSLLLAFDFSTAPSPERYYWSRQHTLLVETGNLAGLGERMLRDWIARAEEQQAESSAILNAGRANAKPGRVACGGD